VLEGCPIEWEFIEQRGKSEIIYDGKYPRALGTA